MHFIHNRDFLHLDQLVKQGALRIYDTIKLTYFVTSHFFCLKEILMALFEGNSNPPLFLALFPVFMMINLPSYLILHEQIKENGNQSAS